MLYKYRSLESQYSIPFLAEQEMWFAAPSELNDPLDCRIPYRFDLASEQWREKSLASYLKTKHPSMNTDDIRRMASQHAQDRAGWLEAQGQIFDQMNPRIGLASFSIGMTDVSAQRLWNVYGGGHNGFAVGLDQTTILQWVRSESGADPEAERIINGRGIQLRPIRVKYLERIPPLNPEYLSEQEIYETIVSTKTIQWSYEAEYRLYISNAGNGTQFLELDATDRKRKYCRLP